MSAHSTVYTSANWVAIVEQCNVEVTLANSFCPSAPPPHPPPPNMEVQFVTRGAIEESILLSAAKKICYIEVNQSP